MARLERVDNSLLATRTDIEAYLRNDQQARLKNGWRHELIGDQLDDLLSGRAGLSFDGKGGLKMITSSEPELPRTGLEGSRTP